MQLPHLIRFYSGGGTPTFLAWGEDGQELEKIELGGHEDILFSSRRACIGYRTPHGYRTCRNRAINVRQCPSCSFRDVSRAYTVGDFSRHPELYETAKDEEYALYLAGFGEDIVKCGVTRKERFEERMREQGSDFGCVIASFTGPDDIYRAEQAIQSRFSFANAVRLSQKISRLSFDKGMARENFETALRIVHSSAILPDFSPNIIDFSPHYPAVSEGIQKTYSILGKVLGAKGEVLIFRSELGKEFAVNMRQWTGSFFERKKEG